MIISILMNEQSPDALSYEQVLKAIDNEQANIVTYCLDFASFHYLSKGYEIHILRNNDKEQSYTTINVSELLENKRPYSPEKEIRRAHNIPKMIKGQALLFLPPVHETFYKVEYKRPKSDDIIEEKRYFEPIIEKGVIVDTPDAAAVKYASSKAGGGWYRVTNIICTSTLK